MIGVMSVGSPSFPRRLFATFLQFIGLAALVSLPASSYAQTLAFPSAEGFGRFASGGRGGDVFIVTSLADSGPGTLRECVEALGPRTCVFAVDGDIVLDSVLWIEHDDITIAGQTAPGQGIQIRHGQNLQSGIFINASNVIIRHIKIRLGPTVIPSSSPNCIQVGGESNFDVSDIIIDHISCAWATDQLISTNYQDRTTIQNSFLYEGLFDSTHTNGRHSMGPNLRGCGVSMIGNLIANNVMRNANSVCGKFDPLSPKSGGTMSGEIEFRNNVVYNAQNGYLDYWNGRGESWVNVAGNVFIGGPNTRTKLLMPYGVDARDIQDRYYPPSRLPSGTVEPMHLCMQDNIGEGVAGVPPSNPSNPWREPAIYGVLNPNDAHIVDSTDCESNPVVDPEFPRGLTGSVRPASETEAWVLANAGAMPWNRDAADNRIATDVATRQGGIIDNPSQVGGWPVLLTGIAPTDSDADGMPDQWEVNNGLNPNDPVDRNDDEDNDGYTNLEEYLNERAAGAPPPRPLVRLASNFGLRDGPPNAGCGPKSRVGTQFAGAEGVAVEFCIKRPGQPQQSIWWKIDFTSGPDGWVREDFLELN